VVIEWKKILKERLQTKVNWTQLHLAAIALMDAEEVASLDGLSLIFLPSLSLNRPPV
jgi:hypothetical protein